MNRDMVVSVIQRYLVIWVKERSVLSELKAGCTMLLRPLLLAYKCNATFNKSISRDQTRHRDGVFEVGLVELRFGHCRIIVGHPSADDKATLDISAGPYAGYKSYRYPKSTGHGQ